MTTWSGRARRAALVTTLALPLSGAALLTAAAPAAADVTSPGRGTEYTEQASRVTISATFGRSSGTGSQRLYLTAPGGAEVLVASADGSFNGGTLNHAFDLDCWTADCRFAPNGTWTIRQEGNPNSTSTFVTRIAPAAPTDVSAAQDTPKQARVTWRRGKEPDLTGFQIVEGGAVVKSGIGLDACDASTCSAVVSYADEGSGRHSYSVRALRSDGSGDVLASGLSAPAETELKSAPPPPAPAPTTGSGDGSGAPGGGSGGSGGQTGGTGSAPGSGGGGTGGSPTSGGSSSPGASTAPTGSTPVTGSADDVAVAQRKAFALGFSAFGPKLGIPKLPPLPQAQAPAIAPELADGTYEPTLGFEDQVLTERVEVAQGPTARVRDVVGTALDSERLATSTAGALVLLLAGAHLRRWLGAAAEEQ